MYKSTVNSSSPNNLTSETFRENLVHYKLVYKDNEHYNTYFLLFFETEIHIDAFLIKPFFYSEENVSSKYINN